jgi:hypothetical protein
MVEQSHNSVFQAANVINIIHEKQLKKQFHKYNLIHQNCVGALYPY